MASNSKRTILMIHGMWGTGDYWKSYRVFFEERGYLVHTPTLRYHDLLENGQPHPELGTTSLRDYCDDLEKEIRSFEEPPILMGHSMGGLIVQILAARGLGTMHILITPSSPRGIMALKPSVLKSFSKILLRWGFWRKPHRQSFEKAVFSRMHLLPEKQQKEYYSHSVYESGRAAFEIGFWTLDRSKASAVDESVLDKPILIVSGKEDRITPNPIHHKIKSKYGNLAELHEYEHHAHSIVHEPGWQQVAEDIEEWIKKHATG